MKKLLSLLIACAMMTCAFTACGDDDDDDDDKKSTSTSATKDDDDDEDDTTSSKKTTASKEEETTEEKTTEDEDEFEFEGKWQTVKVVIGDEEYDGDIEGFPVGAFAHMELLDDGSGYMEVAGEAEYEIEWTEKSKSSIEVYNKEENETIKFKYKNGELVASEDDMELTFEKVKKFTEAELPTEDDDDKPSAGEVDSKIIGEWETTEQGFNGTYTFAENGYGSVSLDASSMFRFEGETLVVDGSTEIGPDQYEFDGEIFTLDINGTEFMTMEKVEGSKNSLDGKYEIVSGYFYDMFEEQYANTADYGLFAEADGEDFWFTMENCFTFTADGKTLEFDEGADLMNNQSISYTIMGEKMTFKAGGATQILTKK